VLADRVEILPPSHEGQREVVELHLEPGVEQGDVLRAHGGQRDRDVGQIEPLARSHAPADLDPGHDLAVEHLVHPQAHRAVGEVADVPHVDQLRESLPGDGQTLRGPLDLVLGEHDLRVARELGYPAGHGPDAQLRAGKVGEDRHLALRPLSRGADRHRGLGVLLGGPVGEVEPRHVHARGDHPLEDLGLLRGGPDGRDDLRGAHGRHGKYSAARCSPL
jgi:hypothetical protein